MKKSIITLLKKYRFYLIPITILIVILVIVYIPNQNNSTDSSENIDVIFEWNDSIGAFAILNQDYSSWYDVNFFLNYTDNISTGYKFHMDELDNIVPHLISDSDFSRDNGDVYNYELEKPFILLIQAKNQYGRKGTFSRSW